MHFDNIRVSRKLWGMFLVLMLAMLLISGVQQVRTNGAMAQAVAGVLDFEHRSSQAQRRMQPPHHLRFRGATARFRSASAA